MRSRWISALAICLFSVITPAAFATTCDGVHQFCGYIYKATASSPAYPYATAAPAGYVVHFCDSPDGSGTCYAAETACGPDPVYQNCNGFNAGPTVTGTCTLPVTRWYIFIASSEGWGSAVKPVAMQDLQADCPVSFVELGVPPGPLVPTINSPANSAILSVTSVNVKYNSGIDADRNSASWPATYDVFVKHWATGTTEPSSWGNAIYSGPCNPYLTGQCHTTVPLPESGNYRVKVVANLDVSSSVASGLRPLVLSTSHNVTFWVNNGRCFGCGR